MSVIVVVVITIIVVIYLRYQSIISPTVLYSYINMNSFKLKHNNN